MSDKKADYDVEVKGVEISPDPIARGQPATFSIAATTGTLLFCKFCNCVTVFPFIIFLISVIISIFMHIVFLDANVY